MGKTNPSDQLLHPCVNFKEECIIVGKANEANAPGSTACRLLVENALLSEQTDDSPGLLECRQRGHCFIGQPSEFTERTCRPSQNGLFP
jgi:hypothetical protein